MVQTRNSPGTRLTTSLSILVPKALLICWAIRGHPNRGLRCFISTMAQMSSCDGPLGPGFRLLLADEYSSRYLRYLSRLWNFNRVDGRIMTAARLRWRGLRNSEQKPNRNRSSAERLGARCRERLMIRSCCFISRLSAMTALTPPGPSSLAMVVNRWARSTSRSFMAEQGRDYCIQ